MQFEITFTDRVAVVATDFLAALVEQTPALVGAGIAVVSAILAIWYRHSLHDRAVKREKRKEKLEELVMLSFEADEFHSRHENYWLHGRKLDDEGGPFHKIRGMAFLYFRAFPEIGTALSAWLKTEEDYRQVLIGLYHARRADPQGKLPGNFADTMKNSRDLVDNARDNLIRVAAALMEKLDGEQPSKRKFWAAIKSRWPK